MKMQSLISGLLASALLGFCTLAMSQSAPKITPSDVRVIPFCGTLDSVKPDPKDRTLWDELRVTKSSRLHIFGKKKNDSARYNGQVVYHIGKLALIPLANRTGKLVAKQPSNPDTLSYYTSLELESKLLTKTIKLERAGRERNPIRHRSHCGCQRRGLWGDRPLHGQRSRSGSEL